jgi:hypothetical protein
VRSCHLTTSSWAHDWAGRRNGLMAGIAVRTTPTRAAVTWSQAAMWYPWIRVDGGCWVTRGRGAVRLWCVLAGPVWPSARGRRHATAAGAVCLFWYQRKFWTRILLGIVVVSVLFSYCGSSFDVLFEAFSSEFYLDSWAELGDDSSTVTWGEQDDKFANNGY